ncbi:MAG: hypothetical protein KME64_44335 [Scytonematopsis contorta HA4267-MV1]|jgi:hypothetical protein|nr:hypothetical protein [Scytonematopsis contorta HA4267-MV1]
MQIATGQALRILYRLKLIRSCPPHDVGIEFYRKKVSWGLRPDACSCDIEFVEYLQKIKAEDKNIFHFGTGSHHIVGLENQKFIHPNEIIAITASVPEYQSYTDLFIKQPELAKYYKVFLGDIYTLTDRFLPQLDIVTLFHLCEFYFPENSPKLHHNDASLLQLFLDKLNVGGKILFYKKSFAWGDTEALVKKFEQQEKIKQTEEYKSLLVYSKI